MSYVEPSNRNAIQSIQRGRCIFPPSPCHQYTPETNLSLNSPTQRTPSKALTARPILSTLTPKSTASPRTSASTSTTASSTTLTSIKSARSSLRPLLKRLLVRFNQARCLITQSQTKDLQPTQLNTSPKHNRLLHLIQRGRKLLRRNHLAHNCLNLLPTQFKHVAE